MLHSKDSVAPVDSILHTTKHESRVTNPEIKSLEKAEAKWNLFRDPKWVDLRIAKLPHYLLHQMFDTLLWKMSRGYH